MTREHNEDFERRTVSGTNGLHPSTDRPVLRNMERGGGSQAEPRSRLEKIREMFEVRGKRRERTSV